MTLVRERRNHQALRLSVPPPIPINEFSRRTVLPASPPLSSSSSCSSAGSEPPDDIESLSSLERTAVLGHGNGGTVYRVRHHRTAAIYALKILRFAEGVVVWQQAAREAEIFKRMDSPYIVRCHGVIDREGSDLCFVMEYMEAGSLSDVLLERRRLPEEAIAGITRRVLRGLRYLQGIRIVHRDIKPSNLLIDDRGEVKIADFGGSRVLAESGSREARDFYTGTCAYMSPERLYPEKWGGEGCDEFAGDVWSLGVVILECFVGRFPLIRQGQSADWATLMCAIGFGETVEMPEMVATASPEFCRFVGRCLEKDWRKRATVDELLRHPFLTADAIAALRC